MAATEQNNYNDLLKQAQLLISDGSVTNIRELSKKLGINRNTLMNGFDRNFGIHAYKDIVSAKASSADLIGKETEKDLEVELDGNFATIRSVIVEGQIKTVDELMALTNFKKSEWETVNPKIKKWDVALKLKISKDQEIVKVVPSIYLEVPLRAKHPTAFEPIIHPIQIDLPRLPKVAKRSPLLELLE